MSEKSGKQIIINVGAFKSQKKDSKKRKAEKPVESDSDSDREYEVQFEKKSGSRQEVIDGIAWKTKGGLTKADFTLNARGKYVSKAASEKAAANWEKGAAAREERTIQGLLAKGYRVIDPSGKECEVKVVEPEESAEVKAEESVSN